MIEVRQGSTMEEKIRDVREFARLATEMQCVQRRLNVLLLAGIGDKDSLLFPVASAMAEEFPQLASSTVKLAQYAEQISAVADDEVAVRLWLTWSDIEKASYFYIRAHSLRRTPEFIDGILPYDLTDPEWRDVD